VLGLLLTAMRLGSSPSAVTKEKRPMDCLNSNVGQLLSEEDN
jgi:hypothetical protein